MASIMVMFPVLLVRHMVVQHTDYIKAILVFIVESHIMMWLQGRALAQREKGMNNNTQLKLFDKKGRSFDKHSDALARVSVFDNRGKTFDRYFVIIEGETYVMSHNPTDPQGINQYAGPDETTIGRPWNTPGSLGILLDHIPPEIEEAILERIEDQLKL
jgi:hypothetical protein